MHPSISTSYLLPAILLNPVLFLHSLNTILSRLLPPVVVVSPIQPPPYSHFGPSANNPHINIHASETLCWSYTVLIMIVQMMAFGRISDLREKRRESRSRKQKRTVSFKPDTNNEDKHNDIRTIQAMSVKDMTDGKAARQQKGYEREHSNTEHPSSGTNSESEGTDRTTDSEVIL